MSLGNGGHYRIHDITGRHFMETAQRARLPRSLAVRAIEELLAGAARAIKEVERALVEDFPPSIHASVQTAAARRDCGNWRPP
jgi:serine/threonine-protein kinase HipA